MRLWAGVGVGGTRSGEGEDGDGDGDVKGGDGEGGEGEQGVLIGGFDGQEGVLTSVVEREDEGTINNSGVPTKSKSNETQNREANNTQSKSNTNIRIRNLNMNIFEPVEIERMMGFLEGGDCGVRRKVRVCLFIYVPTRVSPILSLETET